MQPLLKPALYEQAATGEILLKGAKCVCGHVFFPYQTYGCEVCGRLGDDLAPIPLRSEGTVVSAATVHLHGGSARQAPFDVCVVKLVDGPVVRTLLASVGDPPQPGDTVRGRLCEVEGREASQLVWDFRFGVAA